MLNQITEKYGTTHDTPQRTFVFILKGWSHMSLTPKNNQIGKVTRLPTIVIRIEIIAIFLSAE